MGMGVSRHICLGSCFDAGPIGHFSRPIVPDYPWGNYVDGPVLPVPSNDPLDGTAERYAFFRDWGYRNPALSCGISEKP